MRRFLLALLLLIQATAGAGADSPGGPEAAWSALAQSLWREKGLVRCPDESHYEAVRLSPAVRAEILWAACTEGYCGSGGCRAWIVAGGQAIDTFGSRPFALTAGRDLSAIGWFGKAQGCNAEGGQEFCLLTLYWSQAAGKALYVK